mmetsp:Transcript_46564/g.90978  ORF Transcript_46564/g.90978 Transcript_46564/m.90978 type:complete len:151 (-) Transcript_46564:269-721(-)
MLLTNENLVIREPTLNNTIMKYLQSFSLLKTYFLEFLDDDDDGKESLSEVSNYVICMYAWMRGKDITRRIMGQKNRSLSLHTRQKVTVVSNCSTYKKIKKNVDSDDVSNEKEDDIGNDKIADGDDEITNHDVLNKMEISDDEDDDEIDSD